MLVHGGSWSAVVEGWGDQFFEPLPSDWAGPPDVNGILLDARTLICHIERVPLVTHARPL